jgi:hypothetical protein
LLKGDVVKIGIGVGVDMLMLFGGGGAVPEPDAILGSAILQWVRADRGITESSLRISAWNDISGAAKHYTQATADNQPLYDATGGPNGTPIVRLDSTARKMNASLALPAPGTTPTTIWAVMRQNTWTVNNQFVTSPDNRLLIRQRTATPTIAQFNVADANGNVGAALGSWVRMEAYFSNSTSDYLKLLATTATGANAGAGLADTSRTLGGNATGASADADFAELLYVNRALTAGEKTALDAYCTARYGAGLV